MKKITKEELLSYPNRILIAGTRSYDDTDHFNKTMEEIIGSFKGKGEIAFISGAAPSGADKLIIDWCVEHNYPCCLFKADWDNIDTREAIVKTNSSGKRYNAMAGFERNEQMAEYASQGYLFWDKKSSGTKDMLARLKAKHIPFLLIILTECHFNTKQKRKNDTVIHYTHVVAPPPHEFTKEDFSKVIGQVQEAIDRGDIVIEIEERTPPQVLNKYKDNIPIGSVSIMRPSKWGNPYVIGQHGTRDEVIDKFEEDLRNNPKLQEEIKQELKGKNLVCCCKPKRCHGDILLKIANS